MEIHGDGAGILWPIGWWGLFPLQGKGMLRDLCLALAVSFPALFLTCRMALRDHWACLRCETWYIDTVWPEL
jgi:hypothetical protein